MPLFDMPIDQLRKYTGTNPIPEDFDTYWDDSLNSLLKIDTKVEIKKSTFETSFANCSDLYFTGTENARIHAKLLQPKDINKPNPAVIIFHGYQGSSGDWSDDNKLAFVAQGFTVAALDCRGQGGTSQDLGNTIGNTLRGHIIRGLSENDPKKLLFRQIFLDTALLTKIIMDLPNVDKNRIGVTGRSQGGGLSIACSSLIPEIKMIAPVLPFLSDYKRVWELDQAVNNSNAYFELHDYFRKFDPLHDSEKKIFEKLGYIDIHHLAPRIKGEVLMAISLLDTVCPPSTQFAAYNKITSKKEVVVYPDYAHEGNLPGHSDRIFQFLSKL